MIRASTQNRIARIEIRARRVVLAAGPFGSPRILLRSGVPALRRVTGAERAVGERFRRAFRRRLVIEGQA